MSGPQGWAAPDSTGQPPEAPAAAAHGGPPPPAWQNPPGGSPPGGSPGPGWQAPAGWGGPAGGGWGVPPPPEVRPGIVPLRPLGLGELLDGAVGVIRKYPRPTLGLSVGIALLTAALNVPLLVTASRSSLLDGSAFLTGNTSQIQAEIGSLAAGLGASSLISFLSGIVLAGIITAVVGKAVLGQPMTLGTAWTQVRPRLLALVGLALLTLLVVYGGVLLAVVAGVALIAIAGGPGALIGVPLAGLGAAFGVYAYVRLSLAPSALVLEGVGVRQSLRRSGVLVRGDWLRICGILLLTVLITTFISSVLQAPFQVRTFLSGLNGSAPAISGTDLALQSVGSTLALTLVAPFNAAVRALLYVDRRMRAEGLDVALAAAGTGARSV